MINAVAIINITVTISNSITSEMISKRHKFNLHRNLWNMTPKIWLGEEKKVDSGDGISFLHSEGL
jgi:hypothetical protein